MEKTEPYMFNTFVQERLNRRWGEERLILECRKFLLECGVSRTHACYAISNQFILKSIEVFL